jgi:hypothetical protein
MCGVEDDRRISAGTLPLEGRLFLLVCGGGSGGAVPCPWGTDSRLPRFSELCTVELTPDVRGEGVKDIALVTGYKGKAWSGLGEALLARRSTPTAIGGAMLVSFSDMHRWRSPVHLRCSVENQCYNVDARGTGCRDISRKGRQTYLGKPARGFLNVGARTKHAIVLASSRELLAGAVAGDQPCLGILGAMRSAGRDPTARASPKKNEVPDPAVIWGGTGGRAGDGEALAHKGHGLCKLAAPTPKNEGQAAAHSQSRDESSRQKQSLQSGEKH